MRKEKEMFVLSSLSRLVAEIRKFRARSRAERAIGALPFELQKDIGWPGLTETSIMPRNGAAPVAGTK